MNKEQFKVGDTVTTSGDHPEGSDTGKIARTMPLGKFNGKQHPRGTILYGLRLPRTKWMYWAYADELTEVTGE